MKESVSLSTLLLVLFISLKLTDVIDWGWIWVLSPLWVPAGLAIFVLLLILGVKVYAKKKIQSELKKMSPEDAAKAVRARGLMDMAKGNSKSKFQQRLDEKLEQQRKKQIK